MSSLQVRKRKMVPHASLPHSSPTVTTNSDKQQLYSRKELQPARYGDADYRDARLKIVGEEKMETSLSTPLLSHDDSESDRELANDPSSGGGGGGDIIIDPTEMGVQDESSWLLALQVFVPYIIAGLGMVAAGILLDIVQVTACSQCIAGQWN